ncbi:hypothetical protein O6H91_16G087100 [Diphasiastrum complanatum]|nr:hypothetical protein O6H91_16G087100 [Diphasiastrum complanatum]
MGLDGLTLVAEGMWSSGKLCMIACVDGSQKDCNIRICLYMPTELSITQRSVLVGTISSLDGNDAISFDPLSFHQPVSPGFRPSILGMHYKYTKINNVGAIMKREEPLGQSEKIKSSLLKYPSTGSYHSLSEDLRVHSPIISQKSFYSPSYFDLDIIAIEKFVVIDWTRVSNLSTEVAVELSPEAGHVGPKEEGKFVKVAAELSVRHPEIPKTRFPVIHGEGLYNPRTGKMYLVGCKEVSAAWQVLQNSKFNLVDGLDCNVEVIVQFLPKNAELLVKPTVNVTITSRRTKDDPLFSPQVSLQTSRHLYQRQRKGIVSTKSLEAGLRLVKLSLMPMCIASQLIYIRKNKDSAPFISLVMLGVQAMSYGVPFIVGDEALYATRHFNRHEALPMLGEREWTRKITFSRLGEGEWTQEIMFLNKILLLVAFLLNMHLCEKVVKARIQLRTQRPLEPGRIPSERKVLLIFLLIHAMSFLIHAMGFFMLVLTNQVTIRSVEWQQPAKNQNAIWVKEILMGYGGVIQDLFLLPQVLGGAIWDVEGKPLGPVYYIGLTILCMLPHAYDSSREPIYFNSDLTFKANIAMPLLTLVLAFALYDQQRWKIFQKDSSKLMECHASNMLERLPSKLFEVDLIPNVPPSSSNHDSEKGNGLLQESTS